MATATLLPSQEIHRQDIFLHVIPPEKQEPEKQLSPTTQKVIKIAAYVLIALGIALMIGGACFLGIGVAAGAAAIAVAYAEGVIPVGILALIGGCHLLNRGEKDPGPHISSVDIGQFEIGF
jgi:hypothetical protein